MFDCAVRLKRDWILELEARSFVARPTSAQTSDRSSGAPFVGVSCRAKEALDRERTVHILPMQTSCASYLHRAAAPAVVSSRSLRAES